MPTTTAMSNRVPMRDARRGFTRARICQAAREVFYERGYAAATIEDIAAAAGTRRSTLYTHFRDRDEILAAIARDWISGVSEVVARLPGPTPTRVEIDAWLVEIAAFVACERTPTVLLTELGGSFDSPPALQRLGAQLLDSLAARVPAFRRAVEPGVGQGLALARAYVVLRQIGWATLHYTRDPGAAFGRDMLVVAGELFERFVQQQD